MSDQEESMNMDDERGPKDLLAQGWRPLEIMSLTKQTSKKGNEMYVAVVQDIETNKSNEVFMVTTPGKRWLLKSLLEAKGIGKAEDGQYHWKPLDLVGDVVLGLVEHEPNDWIDREGNERKGFQSKVTRFKKYDPNQKTEPEATAWEG